MLLREDFQLKRIYPVFSIIGRTSYDRKERFSLYLSYSVHDNFLFLLKKCDELQLRTGWTFISIMSMKLLIIRLQSYWPTSLRFYSLFPQALFTPSMRCIQMHISRDIALAIIDTAISWNLQKHKKGFVTGSFCTSERFSRKKGEIVLLYGLFTWRFFLLYVTFFSYT